jgi:hypothetical protein
MCGKEKTVRVESNALEARATTAATASPGTGILAILITEVIVWPLFVAGVFILGPVRKRATGQ